MNGLVGKKFPLMSPSVCSFLFPKINLIVVSDDFLLSCPTNLLPSCTLSSRIVKLPV